MNVSGTTGQGYGARTFTLILAYRGTTALELTSPLAWTFHIPISPQTVSSSIDIELKGDVRIDVPFSRYGAQFEAGPTIALTTTTTSAVLFPLDIDTTLPPVIPTPQPSPVNPCDQCPDFGTKQCNPESESDSNSICQCKDGYQGLTCSVPTTSPCLNKASDICYSTNNGFVNALADGTTCENTCSCCNQFIGPDCGTCGLQCQNNGRPYSDCFRCGCPTGFIGDKCQCRKVTGTITITGVNDIIMQSGGALSSSTTIPFEINHSNSQINRLVNSPFPATLTTPLEIDHDLYTIMVDLYNGLLRPLTTKTTQDNAKLFFTVTPSPTSPTTSTIFTFDIIFGCPEYNPHWTNQDTVLYQWNAFGNQFSHLAIIKTLFQNPTNAQTSSLTPSPSTLPPPSDNNHLVEDEEEANGTYHHQSTLISMTIITIIITLFSSPMPISLF